MLMRRAGRDVAWQVASVERIIDENHYVKTFTLRLSAWELFRPGQHVDVRVTDSSGGRAQRSYSIASPPEQTETIDLTIDRADGLDTSRYFHDVLWLGDKIEIRGPIGGPFSWTVHDGGPILLIASGSGIVPLMSMLRHRAACGSRVAALLLYSSRAPQDLIYADELCPGHDAPIGLTVIHTFTRHPPPGWTGHHERINSKMLEGILQQAEPVAHAFVCGRAHFVDVVACLLVELGVAHGAIRTKYVGSAGE